MGSFYSSIFLSVVALQCCVMIVCSIQQSEPAIRIHPFPCFGFPSRSGPHGALSWSSLVPARRFSSGICCAETQSCVRTVPISHPSHLHSAWHPCICSLCIKGMMELQLCLEKGHCLDRWSMSKWAKWGPDEDWGLPERGRTCSWGEGLIRTWNWTHLYLQVPTNKELNIFENTQKVPQSETSICCHQWQVFTEYSRPWVW